MYHLYAHSSRQLQNVSNLAGFNILQPLNKHFACKVGLTIIISIEIILVVPQREFPRSAFFKGFTEMTLQIQLVLVVYIKNPHSRTTTSAIINATSSPSSSASKLYWWCRRESFQKVHPRPMNVGRCTYYLPFMANNDDRDEQDCHRG